MLTVPLSRLESRLRPTATYGAAVLQALARDEAAGRRPQRLTEPDLATWQRFRGRLGCAHLLQLLCEDAGVVQPVPFNSRTVLGPERPHLGHLPEDLVQGWLEELDSVDLEVTGQDYIVAQAQLLGIPSRMARADLHQMKAHQKALELPGTGGQLAHHVASTQDEIFLQDNFLVCCGSWQELTLAGLAAVDLGAPDASFARLDLELEYARDESRRTTFDFVFGLALDKGGAFEPDRLQELFPNARVVLV